MESSKQQKENEEAERLARRNSVDDKGSRRLPKIEERLIWGKYREAPTTDYGRHETQGKFVDNAYLYLCFNAL